MLLSFRFANHRSFRDEQQLNLTPVYDADGGPDDMALEAVPVVGIFGANASGKSNVISAFGYFQTMVQRSDRDSEPGVGPPRNAFRLDPEVAKEPSRYALDLLLDGVRYTYGFSVDDERIAEEWLYSFPFKRKRVVFERTGQSFDWGDESKKSRIRRLEEIVAPTALFLSVAARFDVHDAATGKSDETSSSLRALYSWIQRRVRRIGSNPRDPSLLSINTTRLLDTEENRFAIVELLRAADVGLEDVFVRRPITDPSDTDNLQPSPTGPGNDSALDLDAKSRRPEIIFRHRGAAGSVALGARDESSGTLRLLDLAGRILPILATDGLILVDEIDTSLHPLLTATLIRLFQSPETNLHKAQLVFTTHDATLLGSIDGEDILRRDEVWFTSKRDDGASELFPLTEFRPRRQGENRLKRYLNGSYGAVPELSMELFEQAVKSRTAASGE
jgi:hypothetical protein